MKLLCFLAMFLISLSSFSQEAKFYADVQSIVPIQARNDSTIRKISWRINDQLFTYSEDTISFIANPMKLDTIYYSSKYTSTYDTIICNIKETKTVVFINNSCCPFFNTISVDNNKFPSKLYVEVINKNPRKKYLIKFGEMTRLLYLGKIHELDRLGRSAMSSDVYRLQVFEVTNSENDTASLETVHFVDKKNEIIYDKPAFAIAETLYDFNYLLMNNEPDTLILDLENKVISIKY